MNTSATSKHVGASLALRGAALACVLGSACLVDINPKYESGAGETESSTSGSSTSESSTTDDSCDAPCEFLGQPLSCASGLCFGTVELGVQGDSHIRRDEPDANYGADELLHVEGGDNIQRSLIGLDPLAELAAELALRQATLHELALHLDFKRGGSSLTVHRITQAWSQDSVTWTSEPDYDPAPLGVETLDAVDGRNSLDLLELLPTLATEPNDAVEGVELLSADDANPGAMDTQVELYSSESGRGPLIEAQVSY